MERAGTRAIVRLAQRTRSHYPRALERSGESPVRTAAQQLEGKGPG
ncbi:DUF6118 family protein [Propylenella binzhouense]